MSRSVLSVLTGIVMAGAVIAFGEAIAPLLLPLSAGINHAGHASVEAAMVNSPSGSFVGLILPWGIGTFLGAAVAALMARHARVVSAMIVGCAVMAAAMLNMLTIPHPDWLLVAWVATVVPTAWLAGRLVSPSSRAMIGGWRSPS
jgi:hypothetical protein